MATTPMILLRLTKENYTRYLAHTVEVEQRISRAAAIRASERLRREMTHPPPDDDATRGRR